MKNLLRKLQKLPPDEQLAISIALIVISTAITIFNTAIIITALSK